MKLLYTLLLSSSLLLSQESTTLEDDFLESLEEVSEIATKTKLNIDETPSFVTVLQSEKLQKLGIDTVFEALAEVPGVQLKREISGVPVVLFRGLDQKGEVKLMVDGVTINNSYRGSIYQFLNFPIELVQRVEVIRGAGSVLYGSNAMSGVINVITKSSQEPLQSTLFGSIGSYGSRKIGTVYSENFDSLKIALDAYQQQNSKYIDNTDRHLKDYSVGAHISDKKFSLLARIKSSQMGNAYGLFGVEDSDKESLNNENVNIYTAVAYKESLSKNNSLSLEAGYNQYRQDIQSEHHLYLKSFSSSYIEESYYAEANLLSNSLEKNKMLLGVKFELSKEIKNAWQEDGVDETNRVINAGFTRDILSVYLNDIYSLSSKSDLSVGIRYDNYSDFEDAFSPSLGLVYRVNKSLRLKSQYTHAFRAPSWVEISSRNDTSKKLKAEVSDSIELGLIIKQEQFSTLRLNGYYTSINDMISQNSLRKYIQSTRNNFYGTELEYLLAPNNQTDINLFASYIDATDENAQALSGVANILASASLTYKFDSGFTFGSLLKYLSSSKREESDTTREDFPSSIIFDETLTYIYKEFRCSLIIKDLFDKGRYYALPLKANPNAKDYNDGGRAILLKASWEF